MKKNKMIQYIEVISQYVNAHNRLYTNIKWFG